jgi:hypothetical protein
MRVTACRPQKEPTMGIDNGYQEITEALNDYFDGFYEGNVDKLRRIFHPNCHLYSALKGPLADDDMETVYARVAGRENPADRGDPRFDAILTIDRSGPEIAFVKLYVAIAPNYFTDYLTLLKLDGRWQIITKTYTGVPLAEAKPLAMQAAAE